MTHLAVRLFGYPQLLVDDMPIKVDRRKTLALITYLALGASINQPEASGRMKLHYRDYGRETLAAFLWPDCSQEQAGSYLRQALWDFNKAAGEGWILKDSQSISLNPQADVWVDVHIFESLLAKWKSELRDEATQISILSEAVDLYQNDFLAGFSLHDSPAFDDWQILQTEAFRLQLNQALEALVHLHFTRGEYKPAIDHAQRWLAMDSLNETVHRALMQLYEDTGQPNAALRQYESCQKILWDELGVTPEAETILLYRHINQRRSVPSRISPGKIPERVSQPTKQPIITALPQQTTPFVGREPELDKIKSMLNDPQCRLITLLGIGGSGKTRLAIQSGEQNRSFVNGVYFVGLANVFTLVEMVTAIADALKLDFYLEPGRILTLDLAKTRLFNFLGGKDILCVLDNFEQLNTNADFLTDLLAAAPGVKLIVTSRERLNVPAEWVVEVGGLAYPGSQKKENIQSFAAVQLFVRIAERGGQFVVSPSDWSYIARICQMVEGIPLGVELAATWVKLLSCQEIAVEIDRDLDFLTATWRGMPERHRTLRAVFEHSWNLLSETERTVFCRLSVFRGGFTREAAIEVSGASLSKLAGLVDKSLLHRVSSGRFDIHEVLKQYATEKLAAEPEAQVETRSRHARYFSGWLTRMYEKLKGSEQMVTLISLRTDQQNLRLAWQWLVENHEFEQLQRILLVIVILHDMQGQRLEGQETFSLLLDVLRGLDKPGRVHEPGLVYTTLLALVLAALRRFTFDFGDIKKSIPFQLESIQLAQKLPDSTEKASAFILNCIGPGGLETQQAINFCQQSIDIFSILGDAWGMAFGRLVLADNANFWGGDPALARRSYEISLEAFTEMRNDWGRALCFSGLGS